MSEQHAMIVAVITTKQGNIQGGGAPFFITSDRDTLQKVSMTLEKVLDASAHEIDEDTLVIVAR
ncbi:hypothetical protein [Sporosarcina sp. 6E9]|uniref:capping complex subunit for YIEGIA n=1 Tax=Sporosarcina sp. 6E9 TaxID=2819235 RepID=UPI001B317111|nr:hypothetical protein [Sporosarcina sp. 6E9]